jgi:hypothetical protein
MYFEPGRCAQCGRAASPGYLPEGRTAPPFSETDLSKDGLDLYFAAGPFFCTRHCLEVACRRYFDSNGMVKYYKESDNYDLSEYEKELLQKATRGEGYEDGERVIYSDAPQARQRLLDKQERLRTEHQQKIKEEEVKEWESAYWKYANVWYDERLTKRLESEIKKKAVSDEQKYKMDLILKQALEKSEREAALLAPRPIPEALRMQHVHVLSPSGQGKTVLLQNFFIEDIQQENPPGYIIIDPKGLMANRIARLDVFNPQYGRLRDRLIYINPEHEPLPQLNMFKVKRGANLTPAQERRITNHLTETFAYIFSSSKSPLTQRQSIPFSFLVRFVFFVGGDVNTLMDMLQDKGGTKFADDIARFAKTDDTVRRFFENDYRSKSFDDARGQISARVYQILKNADLTEMFVAKENILDLGECLAQRKIVVVNTSLAQLSPEGSQLLGRYVIAMALSAAYARSAIPKSQWHPTYLVVDEFQDYADEEKTPELLRLAREYNLGVVLAHQSMHCEEIKEGLRTAISTNTAIKYAASPEGRDASYMANNMRSTPEFLGEQQRKGSDARFACYVRGMGLTHPFIVRPPNLWTSEPKMSSSDFRLLHGYDPILEEDEEPDFTDYVQPPQAEEAPATAYHVDEPPPSFLRSPLGYLRYHWLGPQQQLVVPEPEVVLEPEPIVEPLVEVAPDSPSEPPIPTQAPTEAKADPAAPAKRWGA